MAFLDDGELAAGELHGAGELAADGFAVRGRAEGQRRVRGDLRSDAGNLALA